MPPSPSASATETSDDASRTETATEPGTREDEGDEAEAVREEDPVLTEAVPASRPAAAPRMAAEATPPLVDQRIPVLTLGVGLSLMGLGIGFLGVRMRRR
ncbi:hypothetical protein AB0A76_12725 [Streptomyces exfoliatus]|uniref:LPXTG cell wall anchor domain-containing protein n=1 Tax=Streptomyces exfoliatus TaxID=1905 RepID=A0ABV3CV35_STREX